MVGDGDDARETRRVVDAVMHASDQSAAPPSESDEELERELERELGEEDQGVTLEEIERELMRDSDDEGDGSGTAIGLSALCEKPVGTTFTDDEGTTLRDALASAQLEQAGLQVVHFMSATQLPRNKISSTGVRGDAEELDRRKGSLHILISLKVRDLLARLLDFNA